MNRKKIKEQEDIHKQSAADSAKDGAASDSPRHGNGSWQKIEALREKAALKASLADVWDEDFDLDEEILAELDHTAEYFTTQEEEVEDISDDADDVEEFFDDEEV